MRSGQDEKISPFCFWVKSWRVENSPENPQFSSLNSGSSLDPNLNFSCGRDGQSIPTIPAYGISTCQMSEVHSFSAFNSICIFSRNHVTNFGEVDEVIAVDSNYLCKLICSGFSVLKQTRNPFSSLLFLRLGGLVHYKGYFAACNYHSLHSFLELPSTAQIWPISFCNLREAWNFLPKKPNLTLPNQGYLELRSQFPPGPQWSECAKIAQQWGKSNEVKSLGNRSISDNQFLVNIYQYSIFFKITNLVRNLFRGHGFLSEDVSLESEKLPNW